MASQGQETGMFDLIILAGTSFVQYHNQYPRSIIYRSNHPEVEQQRRPTIKVYPVEIYIDMGLLFLNWHVLHEIQVQQLIAIENTVNNLELNGKMIIVLHYTIYELGCKQMIKICCL